MSGGESVGTKKREDTNLGSRKIESGPRIGRGRHWSSLKDEERHGVDRHPGFMCKIL